MKRLAPILLVVFFALVLLGALPSSASAADFELHDVMNGAVPGLNVVVKGSGQGYYNQSIRATFSNTTGSSYTVRVPIGLALVPRDSGVQTMYTAGAEVISVPPGDSQALVIAFCGEMHDSSPDGNDVFSAGGFATGSLLQTLQNINRAGNFGSNAQQAVWHHTDGNDISDNETALDLASGFGALGTTAAAGLAASVLAGGASLLLNRIERNGGSSAVEPAVWPDEGLDDSLVAPDGGLDDHIVSDYQPGELPPELRPPIEIAEIPPPEDPADRIMIASADEGPSFWDSLDTFRGWLDQGGRIKTDEERAAEQEQFQIARDRLGMDTPPENESYWDSAVRIANDLWRQEPPEKDPNSIKGGQIMLERGVFGSGGALSPALDNPLNPDPGRRWEQIRAERIADGATSGLRIIRRAANLQSLANSVRTPQGFQPPTENLRSVVTPPVITRDLSGAGGLGLDLATDDVVDLTDRTGYRKPDPIGHAAWDKYYDRYGEWPDLEAPGVIERLDGIRERMEGK